MTKYRYDVLVVGESTWANNAMVYDTPEQANEAAMDKYTVWTAMKAWRVVEADAPTHEFYVEGSEDGPR